MSVPGATVPPNGQGTQDVGNDSEPWSPQDRYKLLVDSVRDYALFMLDPQGRIQTWNPGAEVTKGYKAEEIIGQHIRRFYTEEDARRGRPETLLARAAADGPVEDEGWRVRKDGTRFWADVIISPVRDSSGALLGFTKVTRDLTQKRLAEEALRVSEERFRLLVEGARDYAIFMLDPQGKVMTWNEGAEVINGYTAGEIIGQHFSRFYPPEDVAAGKCELELAAAKAHGRFEDEGWRIRKDGQRIWANVVISALRNSKGELIGYGKVTRDLTERRNAEAERVRLAQAQEAIRLRDEFLAIASHELKTPITSMRLHLQAVRKRLAEDAPIADKLERAMRGTDRLTALVETLLDVARISTGRFTINLQEFDLATMVRDVVDRYRLAAETAGSHLTETVTSAVIGSWDHVRVEQVLTNLLGNAIKYAAGAPIHVSLTRDGDHAVLAVQDRGPGIPEEHLPRVFGRFERAASLRHYAGLGLGLYVTREIVLAHGGTVDAHNREGGGAEFTVRLPLQAAIALSSDGAARGAA